MERFYFRPHVGKILFITEVVDLTSVSYSLPQNVLLEWAPLEGTQVSTCALTTWEIYASLNKPGRQRQRERNQTKDFMSTTMAVHVRYKSLSISLPSSAQKNVK